MRRESHRERRSGTRISLATPQLKVTNEEILGDLLYPVPLEKAGARRRKTDR